MFSLILGCLVYLIVEARGWVFLSLTKIRSDVTYCDLRGKICFAPQREFHLFMVDSSIEDDDDISQHFVMYDEANTTSSNTTTAGYRPIEAWHKENRNPTHVLDHLKREQAHWKGKFEDLGGDGI